jgi:hypothetical protein
MSRHAKYGTWEEGDYIAGRVNRLDEKGWGVIGTEESPIRVTSGYVSDDDYVYARVIEIDEDAGIVRTERTERPTADEATVWVQQSENPESTHSWYPEYPREAASGIHHCNLFTETSPSNASTVGRHSVDKDEPPYWWQFVHSAINFLLGLVGLAITLGVIAFALSGSVGQSWGQAIGNSSVLLVPFLLGLALTYAGHAVFEYLVWLSGAILGGGLGFVVGNYAVHAWGLSGNGSLLVLGVSISLLAGIVGGLFVVLHYLGIIVGAFVAVAGPIFSVLLGGQLALSDLSLTATTVFAAAIAVVFGAGAAVLAVAAYNLALKLVTSFLGATLLVYLPTLAQSAAGQAQLSFPSPSFLLVFLSGVAVQLFLGSGSE